MGKLRINLEEQKIDMTPMIDVVFQLIIFFMTTIKFKILEGKLETHLPKDVGVNATPVDELLEKVEIHILMDRSRPGGFHVALNGQGIPNLDTLRGRLVNFVKNNPETKVTLYPQVGVNYEQVINVVDECVKADVVDITFAGVTFDA